MSHRDQLLADAYASVGESVDRIACFNGIRREFIDHLPPDLRGEDDSELIWRLFQLRKAGQLVVKHREN